MSVRRLRQLHNPTSIQSSNAHLDRFDTWAVYTIPILFSMVVVATWAGPDVSIGAGDVSPFVRNGSWAERGSLWNHKSSGAGGTAVTAASTIEAAWVRFIGIFGGHIALAQRLFFMVEAAICVGGGVHAARLLSTHKVAVVAGGLLAFFNPFVLLHLPNFLFPLSIGVLGFLLGEVSRAVQGNGSVVRFVVASFPLMYLSTNPPLLVAIAGSLLVAAVVLLATTNRSTKRFLGFVVRGGSVLLVVHLWWIVPFLLVNVGGSEGTDFAAETDVNNWTWVYQQSFLPQVVSLTAHWGWGQSDIFPWGATVERTGWSLLRYVTPLLVVLGVASSFGSSKRRRIRMGSMAACAVVLIIWSQGLQEPFGFINGFMFEMVPGWWLFRDPVSKFGPCLVVIYVMLASAGIQWVTSLVSRVEMVSARHRSTAVSFGLMVAMLVFPLPLYTGEVIPDSASGVSSGQVSIPDEWTSIGDMVSASTVEGKVLVLPLNKNYQVTTTWGYDGVDLAPQFFDRPVLQVLPGGYFRERSPYANLLTTVEQAMVDGDVRAVENGVVALGVSHIVIRRDVDPGALNFRYADAGRLFETAQRLSDSAVAFDGEVAAVVEMQQPVGVVRSVANGLGVEEPPAASQVVSVAEPLISSEHAVARSWNGSSLGETKRFIAESSGPHLLSIDGISTVAAELVEQKHQGVWGVSVVPQSDIEVDGRRLELAPLGHVSLEHLGADDRGGYRVVIDGRSYSVGDPVEVRAGDEVEVWVGDKTRVLDRYSEVGDCNRYDDRSLEEVGIVADVSNGEVTLGARDHAACSWLAVPESSGQLSVPYRIMSGDKARVCLWSEESSSCVEDVVVDDVDGEVVFEVGSGHEALQIFVYSDGSQVPTTVRYGPVLFENRSAVGSTVVASSTAETLHLEEGQHTISNTSAAGNSRLGAFSSVEHCGAVDSRGQNEAGVRMLAFDDGFELAAKAHSACVIADIDLASGERFELSFRHRKTSGGATRFCVWSDTKQECLVGSELTSTDEWESEKWSFSVDDDSRDSRLYFYADGLDDGSETIGWFSEIDIVEQRSSTVSIRPQPSANHLMVDAQKVGTASWDLELTGGSGLVLMAESFSENWALYGVPEAWAVEPVLVDGWAQGWAIEGQGHASIKVRHATSQRVGWTVWVSSLSSLGLLVGVIARRRISKSLGR